MLSIFFLLLFHHKSRSLILRPRLGAQSYREIAAELEIFSRFACAALGELFALGGAKDGYDVARVQAAIVPAALAFGQFDAVDFDVAAGACADDGMQSVEGAPVLAAFDQGFDARPPEDNVQGVLGDAGFSRVRMADVAVWIAAVVGDALLEADDGVAYGAWQCREGSEARRWFGEGVRRSGITP